MGQGVRADLELVQLGAIRDSAFVMKIRSGSGGRPQGFALPASVWIIDAAVHVFAEEAHRIGDVNIYKFAVYQSQESFVAV